MAGMNRHTGRRIAGTPQIEQSIINLLGIRMGECVMMNDLGSEAVDLTDSPQNQFFLIEMAMGVMDPIRKWIKKVTPKRLQHVKVTEQGEAGVLLQVIINSTGELLRIEPIVLTAAGYELAPGKEIGQ